MHTLICQLCNQPIAKVDPDKLSLPLMGSMFEPLDPDHGYPPPFPADADWQYMMCPYGPHRPFTNPNQVLTEEEGLITVEGDSGVLNCPRCKADDIGMLLEKQEIEVSGELVEEYRCPIHGIIPDNELPIKEEPDGRITEREPDLEGGEQPLEEGEAGHIERPDRSESATDKPSGQYSGKRKGPKRRAGRPKGSKTKKKVQ